MVIHAYNHHADFFERLEKGNAPREQELSELGGRKKCSCMRRNSPESSAEDTRRWRKFWGTIYLSPKEPITHCCSPTLEGLCQNSGEKYKDYSYNCLKVFFRDYANAIQSNGSISVKDLTDKRKSSTSLAWAALLTHTKRDISELKGVIVKE